MRGRKPKPTYLHIVDGTYRTAKHAKRLSVERLRSGRPQAPPGLSDRAREIFAEYARLGRRWLGGTDAHKLAVWALLCEEFERDPQACPQARIAALRAFGADLGFDPTARLRFATHDPGLGGAAKKAARYFDGPQEKA